MLASAGATPSEVLELLSYGENHFGAVDPSTTLSLPLEPEPHVEVWRRYRRAADRDGVVAELRRRLVQLRFPVRAGMAATEEYRAATLRGESTESMASATGLELESPESVRLHLHDSPAGTIPVIVAGARRDFVSLVQALMRKNAPEHIPATTGAYMVAGYNNLDRIRDLREAWEADPDSKGSWARKLKRIVRHSHLYQDRFILLAEGPYSGVEAETLGLDPAEWHRASLAIRMEHECSHYFTRRVFGSMRGIALDEVIADYMGVVAGFGHFEPQVLLRCLGLDEDGGFRPGGRLENYLGEPPLSEGAFAVLQRMVRRAVDNLATFDAQLSAIERSPAGRGRTLLALASLTLEEMAAPDGVARLTDARGTTCWPEGPNRRESTSL